MSPRKRTHGKGRIEGIDYFQGPQIVASFKDDILDCKPEFRINAAVIDMPATRRMVWCMGTGLPPPPDTVDTVWSVRDCCPEGKTDNNKKHWWNI